MGAPRKARNKQSVRIRPMQRLTISIERSVTQQLVTNAVKLAEGTYQAATQVKVLSPEILNSKRAPSRSSIIRICLATMVEETLLTSAAAVKLPHSTTFMNISMPANFPMIKNL